MRNCPCVRQLLIMVGRTVRESARLNRLTVTRRCRQGTSVLHTRKTAASSGINGSNSSLVSHAKPQLTPAPHIVTRETGRQTTSQRATKTKKRWSVSGHK